MVGNGKNPENVVKIGQNVQWNYSHEKRFLAVEVLESLKTSFFGKNTEFR